jgi:HD-like signal output (HDOD) protein
MNLDPAKVAHAARQGIPLVVRSHTLPPQTENDLEEILGIFLAEMGRETLKDRLAYCLRELTGNAKKANTKRAYFHDRGLNLDDPDDYDRGMGEFKATTLGNIDHYLEVQKSLGLMIRVTFLIRHQVLYIAVRNSSPILAAELARAHGRLDRSWGFDAMEDAVVDLLDDSEGAGLGIGILVLMLRKMGLDRRSFRLEAVGSETEALLSVPMEKVRMDDVLRMTDDVASLVDSLPPFPENLRNLLALLEDPDVKFRSLAAELSKDPAMTADLLKYLNSARARGYHKIESLEEAIRIVGIQGLKELMYPYGAHTVLAAYVDRQRDLWENASLVSQYASVLGRHQGVSWADQNRVQIAGLLYNLGQIVLTFVHPDLSAKVLDFCRTKGISIEVFDGLAQAINPGELGAHIADRWGFPAPLVTVLRYLTSPQDAPDDDRPASAVVHLAAAFRWVDLGLLAYDQIQTTVTVPGGDLEAFHKEIRRSADL